MKNIQALIESDKSATEVLNSLNEASSNLELWVHNSSFKEVFSKKLKSKDIESAKKELTPQIDKAMDELDPSDSGDLKTFKKMFPKMGQDSGEWIVKDSSGKVLSIYDMGYAKWEDKK